MAPKNLKKNSHKDTNTKLRHIKHLTEAFAEKIYQKKPDAYLAVNHFFDKDQAADRHADLHNLHLKYMNHPGVYASNSSIHIEANS